MTQLQHKRAPYLLVFGIAIIAFVGAVGLQSNSAASLATSIAASAILAISLDLAWGHTGILSLGHGLLFGAAGYSTAILTKAGIQSFGLLVVTAIFTGAVLAFVISVLMFSGRKELPLIYIAMATLALSFIGERVARSWGFVGADTGIAGLVPPPFFGLNLAQSKVFLIVTLIFLFLVFCLALFLTNRDWGLVLTGIKENEQRMSFSGFQTAKVKIQVFTISGAIAGLGGFLYTYNLGVASPTMIGVAQSTLAVVWVLTGGIGTLVGPILGTVSVGYLSDKLSEISTGWWEISLGVILMGILLLFPKGLLGIFYTLWRQITKKKSRDVVTSASERK